MRILQILNSYPGETFIKEHATSLIKHTDIQLSWAFTQTKCSGILPKPVFGLHHCQAIPNFDRIPRWKKMMVRLSNPLNDWAIRKKKVVLNTISNINPDIIHFHFASTAIQWAWIAEELSIPFTFSVRGSDVQVAPFTISGYTEKLKAVGEKAKGVHAVCDSLKKDFCHLTDIPLDKVYVVRTAISPEWCKVQRKPEEGCLISVGRLHWSKGFSDLIWAVSKLCREKFNFKLIIIGEGPERPLIEYMIRDLGLQNRVYLVGKKSHDEIKSYFSKAHGFVLSSLHEGFPNVLAEAMLAGVPIITTNCGGINEVFTDQRNALIVEPGSPEKLACKIQLLLKNLFNENNFTLYNKKLGSALFSYENHSMGFYNFYQFALNCSSKLN